MYITIMALGGATTATSVQRSVWMQSRSQEWWECDMYGFSETDFRMIRATFNHNVCDSCLHTVMMNLTWSNVKVALKSTKGHISVQTGNAVKKRHVSDLEPHRNIEGGLGHRNCAQDHRRHRHKW